jgi:holo-[acyl-carrier protein] synthase
MELSKPFDDIQIGIDIVEIVRFKKYITSELFQNKYFTKKEILICKTHKKWVQCFASKYAAKEAIIKAFSSYGHRLTLFDIEVLNDHIGRPFVSLKDVNRKYDIKLSISHSNKYVIAFCLVFKK